MPTPERSVDAIVAAAEGLYRNTDFDSVLAWKQTHPGGKAIGCLPVYVPREIIHAAEMLPVGLSGHGDIEIIRGDAYFQSYICHLPRSVIELGVSGRLDLLDGMVFPAICDVIRNLSGMWKILFPERYTKYLDVPQNFEPDVGGRFYAEELQSLRGDLERLGDTRITDAAISRSIAVFNENRRLVRELYAARSAQPWLYPTSEVYLVLRAGHVVPVEEHNTLLRDYMAAAPEREGRALDHIRVVVAGAFCEQPPLELIKTIERAGCYVVGDDFLLGYRWLTGDVATTGDPVAALVDAFLTRSTDAPSRYQADGANGTALVDTVRQQKADGVIFCAPSFCDPALLDQPMATAALDSAGVPYTSFKYSENTGQFQVIREQAGTFADSIRLWEES